MNELRNHVNNLFVKYGNTPKNEELKAEILSNLEAKKYDLIADGIDEETAIKLSKESITSIAGLIDGNKSIYINQYRIAFLQDTLLYLIIGWILVIPFSIISNHPLKNLFIIGAIIIVGIIYLYKKSKKGEEYLEQQHYLNLYQYVKLRNILWIVWGIYIAVRLLMVTGIYFISNIWYKTPIQINGPYQLAVIVTQYLSPFITIIIPILASRLPILILKYEAGDNNEE